ncbi:hypothetical protein MSAN_02524200 [Mycena sanguinolenta]|uniref:Uncharacterized protein n=1 Tax=Mycena sanguinolenta TaxID=230812 RepID=A0A8H6WRD8_9AGAR|nr:hypothetical protein MSAN_02524200 [Mycena sanguinolenta]
MAPNIFFVPANLASFAIQSCLYGVYLVLAVTSICLIAGRNASRRRRGTSIHWSPSLVGAIGLFVTITAQHWILIVDRAFSAFIRFPLGPLEFYGNLAETTQVVKTGFLVGTLAIGDALIIHRLWIVWGYNKYVIMFPIGTLIGLVVSGAGITYQFTRYKPGQTVFLSEAGRWITAETVFTFCTNVYCTAFISWRLWNQGRAIQPYGGPSLRSVLAIMVESAAIYTIGTIFYLACYRSQSNLQLIVIDCWPAITGIACMAIYVRVGLGWTHLEGKPSIVAATQPLSFAVDTTRLEQADTDFDCPMDELNEERNKGTV